jgi:hypothetical protein
MREFIEKIWDLPTMEKRMECLKKVIDPFEVDLRVNYYLSLFTDDKLDAMYLAYYDLKDKYCKIDRRKFGNLKTVNFKSKGVNSYGNFVSTFVDTSLTEAAITRTDNASWYYSDSTTSAYDVHWEPSDYNWIVTARTNSL